MGKSSESDLNPVPPSIILSSYWSLRIPYSDVTRGTLLRHPLLIESKLEVPFQQVASKPMNQWSVKEQIAFSNRSCQFFRKQEC